MASMLVSGKAALHANSDKHFTASWKESMVAGKCFSNTRAKIKWERYKNNYNFSVTLNYTKKHINLSGCDIYFLKVKGFSVQQTGFKSVVTTYLTVLSSTDRETGLWFPL